MSTLLLERPFTNEASRKSVAFPQSDQLLPKHKDFHYSIDICLKDSNAYGNTYFARYFEWQGVCRERWFYECISPDMLQSLGVFITKDAHQEYVHETFPFQRVDCKINTFAIKQCSFSLLFRFFVDEKLVSKGYQQIVFADRDKRIARLPRKIIEKIRKYEVVQEMEHSVS